MCYQSLGAPSRSRWWRSLLYSSRAEPRCESVHAFICLWQRQKTLSFVSPDTVTVSREHTCRHMHTFSTPCSEDWMTGGDSFPYGKRRGQAISMAHCTCLTEKGKKEWEGKIRGDAKSLPQSLDMSYICKWHTWIVIFAIILVWEAFSLHITGVYLE